MYARTTAALLAALCAAGLTACSSAKPASPAASSPAAAKSSAAPSQAQLIAACADAIAAGKDEGDGAAECTSLPLKDYYTALAQANQAGRDKLQKLIASASAQ
jgi:hypothetical protein